MSATGSRWVDVGLAALLGAAGCVPLTVVLMAPFFGVGGLGPPLPLIAAILGWLGIAVMVYRSSRAGRRPVYLAMAEVLSFIILPIWGMVYNHEGVGVCEISECDLGGMPFRPLAESALPGLVALQLAVSVAYFASRFAGPLSGRARSIALAVMMLGVLEHLVLAVQFGKWNLAGLMVPPLLLPCLTPLLCLIFLGTELRRLLTGDEPEARRALTLTAPLMALYVVAHKLWLGGWGAAVWVVSKTCDYPLSTVPVVVIPQTDCHYLCTVAAQGHPWLVRPQRLGRRRGVVIVVNRQLAVANAFEDLLHERWPRFGAFARRSYDAVGLPVSRWIRAAWMSDLVYLAMKPAEWCFYLTLRALDPGDPEARIDRMYR